MDARSTFVTMTVYNVLGLMSGTSLDGVDLAFCQFINEDGRWRYSIPHARTYKYPPKWTSILESAHAFDKKTLLDIHYELGEYYGELITNFTEQYQILPDFIGSHGHTIKHKPDKGITLQIGSGEVMVRQTHITVINNFRKKDVDLGGQGAPLVPIGDRLLFGEYDACLNLGGFANVSYEVDGLRKAYDICPVNMALNEIAQRSDEPYDKGGAMARAGELDLPLLKALDRLEYYHRQPPKSLGKEWYLGKFKKEVDKHVLPPQDLLHTVVEHVAIQIAAALDEIGGERVLTTGGGAYNHYLIERIQHHCRPLIIIPEEELVDFKEALIFAFLAVLRVREEVNVLSSVTGARKDHCSGVIHKS